jgi:hypothetical protein
MRHLKSLLLHSVEQLNETSISLSTGSTCFQRQRDAQLILVNLLVSEMQCSVIIFMANFLICKLYISIIRYVSFNSSTDCIIELGENRKTIEKSKFGPSIWYQPTVFVFSPNPMLLRPQTFSEGDVMIHIHPSVTSSPFSVV